MKYGKMEVDSLIILWRIRKIFLISEDDLYDLIPDKKKRINFLRNQCARGILENNGISSFSFSQEGEAFLNYVATQIITYK